MLTFSYPCFYYTCILWKNMGYQLYRPVNIIILTHLRFHQVYIDIFVLFLHEIGYVITRTCLYIYFLLTPPPPPPPLKHHFDTVNWGLQEVYIIFLISAQNIDCGYSLEPPRRGGSNEYPQSVLSRNMKISEFLSENFQFLVVKFSIYLNRRFFRNVWVIIRSTSSCPLISQRGTIFTKISAITL